MDIYNCGGGVCFILEITPDAVLIKKDTEYVTGAFPRIEGDFLDWYNGHSFNEIDQAVNDFKLRK